MGLFGKKKATADDVAAVHLDVAALRDQLAQAEQSRDSLSRELTGLRATVLALGDSAAPRDAVDQRFAELGRRLECVGPIVRGVDELRGRLADEQRAHDEQRAILADQVERADEQRARLASRLDQLAARVDGLPDIQPGLAQLGERIDQLPDLRPCLDQLARRIDQLPDLAPALDELRERLDGRSDHGHRLDDITARFDGLSEQAANQEHLVERLATLDAAVAAGTRRLEEQIVELGRDVDALAGLPSMAVRECPSAGVVDELRAGQARLAGEQVRFQIAVREDVAALAEQLRRVTAR